MSAPSRGYRPGASPADRVSAGRKRGSLDVDHVRATYADSAQLGAMGDELKRHAKALVEGTVDLLAASACLMELANAYIGLSAPGLNAPHLTFFHREDGKVDVWAIGRNLGGTELTTISILFPRPDTYITQQQALWLLPLFGIDTTNIQFVLTTSNVES